MLCVQGSRCLGTKPSPRHGPFFSHPMPAQVQIPASRHTFEQYITTHVALSGDHSCTRPESRAQDQSSSKNCQRHRHQHLSTDPPPFPAISCSPSRTLPRSSMISSSRSSSRTGRSSSSAATTTSLFAPRPVCAAPRRSNCAVLRALVSGSGSSAADDGDAQHPLLHSLAGAQHTPFLGRHLLMLVGWAGDVMICLGKQRRRGAPRASAVVFKRAQTRRPNPTSKRHHSKHTKRKQPPPPPVADVHRASGRAARAGAAGRHLVLGLDASESAWRRLDARVRSYPYAREFTAIGSGGASFRQAMVAAVAAVGAPPTLFFCFGKGGGAGGGRGALLCLV